MSAGIPFGFLPNAGPDDLRLLLQRSPFDPDQEPSLLPVGDANGLPGGILGALGAVRPSAVPPAPATDAGPSPALEQKPNVPPVGLGADPVQQPAPAPLGGPVAALFNPRPMGPEQRFTGSTGVTLDEPAPAPAPLAPRSVANGLAPAPAPLSPPIPTPPTDVPATGTVTSPAPVTPPAPAPVAATTGGPSFGDRLLSRLRDNADYLGALGAGLLSSSTMSGGVAAGMQLANRSERDRAVRDLAKAEHALKLRKLAQEQRQLSGNAQFVKSKIPGITDDQAAAFGANPSFMTELMKGQLPAAELYRQYTDDQGNVWNQNTRTGQSTVALQARDDKPQLSEIGTADGMRQKALVARDGSTTPVGQPYRPTSANTITIGSEKAQDKVLGEELGKKQIGFQTAGQNASSKINTLNVMEQMMNRPGFYSGPLGERAKQINGLLAAAGIRDVTAASGAEVFDALASKATLDQLGGSLGPGVSNTDRDYIGRVGPGLDRSEAGNRELIGIHRKVAERERVVAKMAREYAAKSGGRIDETFLGQLEEFANANPLFPVASAGARAMPPGEAPKGAPTGARQAPDGNWYVADPDRPGKYMRVQ